VRIITFILGLWYSDCSGVLLGILRYNEDLAEPVILTQACDLSSFGFFQRGTLVPSRMVYPVLFIVVVTEFER
jgi:hypothetical protein